ncbi:hypothetical protein [Desulfobacca acetoxidans]|uniref:DUF304 domain-containing protein n=1 Tax=Desulfobacca acetoxidans (strain ATCC 700848 / DSM 11109 / ASRB2) TaxID=880072 RepID=F2NFV9_DESAR|nr:hypothetical protein [Desulfobacca acetoxidans]AEB10228.1 hypothetical protein Desac_2407 [Desulfobacca acetoxidans DSM 11109]
MNQSERHPDTKKVFTTSWRAFYLYYLAIAICWFGPQLNPDFADQLGLSPAIGLVLGTLLLAGVWYLKWGQEYAADSEGVMKIWHYPRRREIVPWPDIAAIKIRCGLTQTLLGIGNIVIQKRQSADKEIVWYGMKNPKQIKTYLERGLDEFTSD